MEKTVSYSKITVKILMVSLAILLATQSIVAQGWYDVNWQYRKPVAVENPGTTTLTDFQVKIILNNDNFNFDKVNNDRSDIRVTSDDGTTLIPFWIGDSNFADQNDTIWVKMPSIPAAGTSIFIYYGNLEPDLPQPVEMPPTGPFSRPLNPIVDSISGITFGMMLAENIVNDAGTYWMAVANYNTHSVDLLRSYTPTDPFSWNFAGNVYTDPDYISMGPHLIKEGENWYVFFATWPNIVYMTSPTIEGLLDLSNADTTLVLPVGAKDTWEDRRVDEPYVFKDNNGKWILIYMGDSGADTEQIGYAISDNIGGPYVKYSGNPCIPFGSEGSYDAGTIADPWVYEYDGTYYIGYTAGSIQYGVQPWVTACATTTDWQNFYKIGVIYSSSGSGWDSHSCFRGAVTRVGDNYLLSYVGTGVTAQGDFRSGVARQPVYTSLANIINNPDSVFDFYDDFGGTSLDFYKWKIASGSPTQLAIGGGILTLTSQENKYIKIDGGTKFGEGYVCETYARDPNQGISEGWLIDECGFGFISDAGNWTSVRIIDNETSFTNWELLADNDGPRTRALYNGNLADKDFNIFRVFRQGSGVAGYQIDNYSIETIDTNVPTIDLPPYIMSYTQGADNDFDVDWIRVRKWVGSDPVTVVGIEQDISLNHWIGSVNSDWNTSGNWSSGVPEPLSNIAIFNAPNYPVITASLQDENCNNLTIEPSARVTIETGGTLTVGGTLTINSVGPSNSGSLVVNGTLTAIGPVTYNRYMPLGSAWHYVSSPVSLNTDPLGEFWAWDEVAGDWSPGTIDRPESGRGYTLQAYGTSVAFTGSLLATEPLPIIATSPYSDPFDGSVYSGRNMVSGREYGGGGWNLLGNPYTSAIDVSAFIDANYSEDWNMSKFDPNYVALYLYNGSTYQYVTRNNMGWDNLDNGDYLNATHIQVGQGFFVLAMNDQATFNFSRTMQGHNTNVALLKSAKVKYRWPGLQLKAKYGEVENLTTIVFNDDMTAGLDPGYDVGLMSSGSDIEIYTVLVEDNGINFALQALPENGSVKNVIPVGLDFEKGGDVTFSADCEPLRTYKYVLEDRITGIFTDLNADCYSVTLPAKTYGTGRFFVHVSTGRSIKQRPENDNLLRIRIWASQNKQVNIQGTVRDKSRCEVFDPSGRKIFATILSGSDFYSFSMPSSSKGVYIVKIMDGSKIIIQKVIIL
jgi:hypothetical protein